MTAEEKRGWLVSLFVAVLDSIELDEISEDAGDRLVGFVESMSDEDAEEVFTNVTEALAEEVEL
jgi:hypothetical protein